MDLLLDSTVFYDDPNLSSENWALIEEYVKRTGSRVLVPAVVRDEIRAKFFERLKGAQGDMESARHSIERLTRVQFKTPSIDVAAETMKYLLRLDSRLKRVNGRTLAYPSAAHPELVERELNDLRPFQPKGTGYRDALIWYSLLEYLKKEPRDCILVTKNTNDFSAQKDEVKLIHGDLASDLKAAGVATSLEIRRNLDEFISDFVKPVLQKLGELKLELEKGKPVDLKQYLEGNFNSVFEQLNLKRLRISIPGVRLEEPVGVSTLGEPSEIRIDDVLELNASEVYIEFHADYEANVYGFVTHFDAFNLDEDSGVSVTDMDWSEHYAEVEASVNLEVRFSAIYDREENDVVSLEVKEARSEREY
jgi:hypothetical protein